MKKQKRRSVATDKESNERAERERRIRAVTEIIGVIDTAGFDLTDGGRGIIDILEATAKIAVPFAHVRLTVDQFNPF